MSLALNKRIMTETYDIRNIFQEIFDIYEIAENN